MAGNHVIQIDLEKDGTDVRLMKLPDRPIYGILAAPPCTCFAIAGNGIRRTNQAMIDALSIVDACLRLVFACRPKFWALENPVGKLRHYLGEPAFYFDPCDYGDHGENYTKRTCLWGEFNAPKPRNRLEPIKPPNGHHSIDKFNLQRGVLGGGVKRSRVRSVTPSGFAQAFFEVNR
ncbi:MAG: hypothetical protein GY765_16655 [bacterium]|nr:hypothetical protein [bacterium]